MRIVGTILIAATMVLLPLAVVAQMSDQAEVEQITREYDLGLSKRPSLSLIDLSRLHMTQSYSLSFFSGSGQSGSVGLYSNTITYQLANPLTLTLNLGILHNPGSLLGNKSSNNSTTFLPSGWLDWRPSKNFSMSIGFETIPAYRNGYYNAGRSWYRYR